MKELTIWLNLKKWQKKSWKKNGRKLFLFLLYLKGVDRMKTIPILGHDYLLQFVDPMSTGGSCGIIDLGTQEIRINRDITASMKYQTVIHEIIEATDHHLKLDIPHNVIEALGEVIAQGLTKSGLVKWNIEE